MVRHDHSVAEDTTCCTDFPLFRCPICRKATLKRWYDRPLNVTVNNLAEEQDEYADRAKESEEHMIEWLEDTKDQADPFNVRAPESVALDTCNIDLAHVAAESRASRASELFQVVFPVLLDAALAGLSRVTFVTKAKELHFSMHDLSALLFRHGVHSVVSSSRETTVFLTHDGNQWEREWKNEDYNDERINALAVTRRSQNN
jgi:hypothetical protein